MQRTENNQKLYIKQFHTFQNLYHRMNIIYKYFLESILFYGAWCGISNSVESSKMNRFNFIVFFFVFFGPKVGCFFVLHPPTISTYAIYLHIEEKKNKHKKIMIKIISLVHVLDILIKSFFNMDISITELLLY